MHWKEKSERSPGGILLCIDLWLSDRGARHAYVQQTALMDLAEDRCEYLVIELLKPETTADGRPETTGARCCKQKDLSGYLTALTVS